MTEMNKVNHFILHLSIYYAVWNLIDLFEGHQYKFPDHYEDVLQLLR